MKRTIIAGGNVILPDRVKKCDVLIENGMISDVGTLGEIPPDADIIDAGGMYVSPGFVEIHAHGGGGFDFMDSTVGAFEAIARVHLSHGTTSIAPTTVACGREAMSKLFELYRKVTAEKSRMSYLGLHLEGPYISLAQKGAQNPFFIHTPTKYEVDALMEEAGDIISMCTAAPELCGIDYMAEAMLSNQITLSVGHSDAVYSDVEKAVKMGFCHYTHLYSNTPTVRKINQVVYAGAREAAYLLDDMKIELIGDGHHVPKEVLLLALKVKGADNVNLTSDAMRTAGTNASESYLGEICPENRVIIEDGVAKLPDRSFYAGSIATGDVMLRWAVRECGVGMCDAVRMLSLTPASIIGADKTKGSIERGKDADVLIIDDDLNVKKVITGGGVKF